MLAAVIPGVKPTFTQARKREPPRGVESENLRESRPVVCARAVTLSGWSEKGLVLGDRVHRDNLET
jgi:hypothetical protein